jgi:hypothetical protein
MRRAAYAFVGALLIAHAEPAGAAVTGLNTVISYTVTSSESPQLATAYCASDQKVAGGGGTITQAHAGDPRPVLTTLRPVRVRINAEVTIEGYAVAASEVAPGTDAEWSVKAWAKCVDALPGQHIVAKASKLSSASKQPAAVACPSGQRAIGSGARIRPPQPAGGVQLQVARPSASGDIVRAQAHERAGGYPGKWSVIAYAVCAAEPEGYQVQFAPSPASDSEAEKTAGYGPLNSCLEGSKLLSSGAAVGAGAPAGVSLFAVTPTDGNRTIATAVESTPVGANWGFVVATRVCAAAGP